MSQSKRNDFIFYGILVVIVLVSILGTSFAIHLHNKNVDENNILVEGKEEVITPYLTFREVSKKDTIDVFKSYPINPIKIETKSDKITISGLKDREVQKKINDKLSILDNSKNEYGNFNCSTTFNFSNVLSISCSDDKSLNINLVTGDEIELEDIFNKDTDIYSALLKSNYSQLCQWHGCGLDAEQNSEYENDIENIIADNLRKIKNKEYSLALYDTGVQIKYKNSDDLNFDYTSVNYYDFIDDITILDRFLDNSIYEEKVSSYCEVNNCEYKIKENQDDYYMGYEYLNDKAYMYYLVSNYTKYDAGFDRKFQEEKLDINRIGKLLIDEIIEKENLGAKGNQYTYYAIRVNIFSYSKDKYHVCYTITKKEFEKNEFIKYRLEFTDAKYISRNNISKVNMLLDKNYKIDYLDDNPKSMYHNFENKLYNYILNDVKTNEDSPFSSYLECYEESCEESIDFHNLIDEASYVIDKENNRMFMYYIDDSLGVTALEVRAFIPLDVFIDKNDVANSNDSMSTIE